MTRLNNLSPNKRAVLIVGTLVALLLISIIVWVLQRNQTSATQDGTKTFDLTGQPFLGKADAPVTLVAFEDFKCPVCKNFEGDYSPGGLA